MKRNRMKEKLKAGEPVFGMSVMIPSPQIVEMAGAAGFDWVLLDCEHGTLTLESVELMAMAAEACGITAIARPVTRSADEYRKILGETAERLLADTYLWTVQRFHREHEPPAAG